MEQVSKENTEISVDSQTKQPKVFAMKSESQLDYVDLVQVNSEAFGIRAPIQSSL